MTLQLHPAVQRDFDEAIAYYEDKAGLRVADRFEEEFRASIAAIKTGPTRFPFYHESTIFRRVRLRSFPYIVVYRRKAGVVRVTLLKHERRHPLYGMHRW